VGLILFLILSFKGFTKFLEYFEDENDIPKAGKDIRAYFRIRTKPSDKNVIGSDPLSFSEQIF
jgi:hypothetical protein